MVDRQDIDALLVGALYGELTPAEAARLTAHLESHPADRTVLADLTHTRQAIRDSRVLAVQVEPPQAVCTLLLQEAARRAPRRVESEEKVGWFQRFTKSFLGHPAMAAAAMLVIIVSVAGTIYVRKGDHFSEAPAPVLAPAREEATTASTADHSEARPQTQPPADDTATKQLAQNAEAAKGEAVNGKLEAKADGKTTDSYRVDLASGAGLDKQAETKPEPAKPAEPTATSKDALERSRGEGHATAPAKKAKAPAGITVTGREAAPMDFAKEQADPELQATKPATEPRYENHQGALAGAGTGPGAGAGATGGASAPSANTGVAVGDNATFRDGSPAPAPAPAVPKAPGAAPSRAPQAASPPPAPKPSDRRAQDKIVASHTEEEKAGEKGKDRDEALLQWAKEQHQRVLDSVRRNNCPGAASIAVAIFRTAPDYYRDNVATDRSLKSCLAYINNEHDKEVERVRAAKQRAMQQNDAPAAAPAQRR